MQLGNKIKDVRKQISDAMSVLQMEELKHRRRVLRRLGFINEADVVQLKARVACEISTGDELVLSELLFNRFFNELTPRTMCGCSQLLHLRGEEQRDTDIEGGACQALP